MLDIWWQTKQSPFPGGPCVLLDTGATGLSALLEEGVMVEEAEEEVGSLFYVEELS